jgi:hypothetical protein
VNDLSFVLSFAGATLGNALIYVFPALMFNKMVEKLGNKAIVEQKAEVKFATFTCLLGIAKGGINIFKQTMNVKLNRSAKIHIIIRCQLLSCCV